MAAKKRKPKNHLADKTANVALHRNGLTIEIPNVNATDAPYVAAALLDAARRLVKRGYEELVQDAGGVHGGPLGEYSDDDHAEEARKKHIGFTG